MVNRLNQSNSGMFTTIGWATRFMRRSRCAQFASKSPQSPSARTERLSALCKQTIDGVRFRRKPNCNPLPKAGYNG